VLLALFLLTSPATARRRQAKEPPDSRADTVRITLERTGAVNTKDGLRLLVRMNLGNVRILTAPVLSRPQVRYAVHIETDSRNPHARQLLEKYSLNAQSVPDGVWMSGDTPRENGPPKGGKRGSLPLELNAFGEPQLWVNLEVSVPPSYSVDIATLAGDIQTEDVGGAAILSTQGGNISAGRVGASLRGAAWNGPVARLETKGGHIKVADVSGDLYAYTAGGHIAAQNVAGSAFLHTGGGHIRAGRIVGRADLETGGGNITVGEARGGVSARTAGGQIDLGEALGPVRAQTGGGGIRVVRIAGPMDLETRDGSICLTRVAGPVRATTRSGTITAWINPDAPEREVKRLDLSGASALESGNGDIVVYLPRNLAATIEAVVENGAEDRIQADPGLPLKFIFAGERARAEAALNGGGQALRIKTGSGAIRLQYLDSGASLQNTMVRQQTARIEERLEDALPAQTMKEPPDTTAVQTQAGWINRCVDSLEEKFFGGVRVYPDELEKRLVFSEQPAYPEIAKRAGIEGRVILQVRVDGEGRVEVVKVLEGQAVLAEAAISAAQKRRYRALRVDGEPMSVVSTVSFNFELH
jgi:TonB family protein